MVNVLTPCASVLTEPDKPEPIETLSLKNPA